MEINRKMMKERYYTYFIEPLYLTNPRSNLEQAAHVRVSTPTKRRQVNRETRYYDWLMKTVEMYPLEMNPCTAYLPHRNNTNPSNYGTNMRSNITEALCQCHFGWLLKYGKSIADVRISFLVTIHAKDIPP